MTEPTKGRGKRPEPAGLPLWSFGLATGFIALALFGNAWVGLVKPGNATWWALFGESNGGFSALFSAGALLAALWAVHLQRQQNQESSEATARQLAMMSEQAATMGEQLSEFARAADAQRALVKSQNELAGAQGRANTLLEMQIEAANHALKIQRADVAARVTSSMIGVASHFVTQTGMASGPVPRDSFNWQLMRYLETAERILREMEPRLTTDVDMAGAFSTAYVSRKGGNNG